MRIITKLVSPVLFFASVVIANVSVADAEDNKGGVEHSIDRIVGVVNNRIILWSELHRSKARAAQAMGKKAVSDAALTKLAMKELIERALLVEAAKEAKIRIKEADLDRAVAQIKQRNRLTDKELLAALEKQGYTMAGYRRELRYELLKLRATGLFIHPKVHIKGKPGVKPFKPVEKALRNRLYQSELAKQLRIWLAKRRATAYISLSL